MDDMKIYMEYIGNIKGYMYMIYKYIYIYIYIYIPFVLPLYVCIYIYIPLQAQCGLSPIGPVWAASYRPTVGFCRHPQKFLLSIHRSISSAEQRHYSIYNDFIGNCIGTCMCKASHKGIGVKDFMRFAYTYWFEASTNDT